MPKTLIAVADSVFPNLEPTERVFSKWDATVRLAKEPTLEGILEVARKADGLMVTFAQLTAELIQGLDRCRAIGRFGIGVDNIDLDAATKAGIQVCFVPDYCLDEVSDHAMALLTALARKITYSNALVQENRWEGKAVAPIYRLRGRTIGLVGLGKIPQTLVPKAQAFGLNVMAYDPFVSNDVASALNVKIVDFEVLLENADYVSIHAPLTPDTLGMFNADAFKRMKPGALLVNTARGPLVDEGALAAALDEGQLGGAALDVLTDEPPPAGFQLLNRDNVILTPHMAYYSEDALLDLQTKAAEDVASVLSGEEPRYPVNKLA
ncbi:MAG: C-terminal binding protein [Gammaproteobacteria bacterium]